MWEILWCFKQTCTLSHICEFPHGFALLALSPAGLPAKEIQQQMLQFPSLLEVGMASGMSCWGEGGSLRRAFPHPVYELAFCSVFLRLLPLPSVIFQPRPSPHPTRSLASLNPHARSPCLHSSSSRPPLPPWIPSLFQACGCVLSQPNTTHLPLWLAALLPGVTWLSHLKHPWTWHARSQLAF